VPHFETWRETTSGFPNFFDAQSLFRLITVQGVANDRIYHSVFSVLSSMSEGCSVEDVPVKITNVLYENEMVIFI
jgi:hypothetical protein